MTTWLQLTFIRIKAYFLCLIDWYILGSFIVSINIWIFFFMTIVASCMCCMIIVKLFVIIVIIFNSRTVCDWKTRREGFTHYLLLETSSSGLGFAVCNSSFTDFCVLRLFNLLSDGDEELNSTRGDVWVRDETPAKLVFFAVIEKMVDWTKKQNWI